MLADQTAFQHEQSNDVEQTQPDSLSQALGYPLTIMKGGKLPALSSDTRSRAFCPVLDSVSIHRGVSHWPVG